MAMKFHHVGVACRNIVEEIESIRKIHELVDISPIVSDTAQKAELCMLQTAEGVSIELISGEQVKTLLKRGLAIITCVLKQMTFTLKSIVYWSLADSWCLSPLRPSCSIIN